MSINGPARGSQPINSKSYSTYQSVDTHDHDHDHDHDDGHGHSHGRGHAHAPLSHAHSKPSMDARTAFAKGDVEASRMYHQNKATTTEHHGG